jgi:hypothetical protein
MTKPTDNVLPQLRIADLAQSFDEDLYGAYVVMRDPPAGVVPADLEALPEAGRLTALRKPALRDRVVVSWAVAALVWWRWARDELAADEGR